MAHWCCANPTKPKSAKMLCMYTAIVAASAPKTMTWKSDGTDAVSHAFASTQITMCLQSYSSHDARYSLHSDMPCRFPYHEYWAVQALHARPGAPLFVRAEREALTVLLPMRQNKGREGALASAFVQVRPHVALCLGIERTEAHHACSYHCGNTRRCLAIASALARMQERACGCLCADASGLHMRTLSLSAPALQC